MTGQVPRMARNAQPTPEGGSDEAPLSLEALRRRIGAMERYAPPAGQTAVNATGGGAADGAVPLGLAALDRHLPWGGLPRAALHEITGAGGIAAGGFAAALLGLLAAAPADRPGNTAGPAVGRAVVWCRRTARGFRPDLYGAGLLRFGLSPQNLILAGARDGQSVLWTLEECLKSRAVAAVLGEMGPGDTAKLDTRALRRLQLAAETSGVTALLLHADAASPAAGPVTAPSASPAVTRWRIGALPGGHFPGTATARAAWRVELTRCRGGGRPGNWNLFWTDGDDGNETNKRPARGFRLAA